MTKPLLHCYFVQYSQSWSSPCSKISDLPYCQYLLFIVLFALCAEAGVKLTAAGSTYPYGIDPEDNRIAPSHPSTEQLYQSMHVFYICQQIAALEVLQSSGRCRTRACSGTAVR